MTEHCRFRNCFHPEDIGCHAGEPDHKKCHHWQIGQLRNECQKTREILLALAGVEDVRADVPGMLSVLYRMQQSVNPADGPSIAVTIRALEFLRDTEPEPPYGVGLNDAQKIMLNDAINLAMLVRRLAARLKKIAPDDGLADRAMGCLQRLGFSSPWRDAAPDLADTCSG